jgi:hypothetical protein
MNARFAPWAAALAAGGLTACQPPPQPAAPRSPTVATSPAPPPLRVLLLSHADASGSLESARWSVDGATAGSFPPHGNGVGVGDGIRPGPGASGITP